jgi:hypothetical protein
MHLVLHRSTIAGHFSAVGFRFPEEATFGLNRKQTIEERPIAPQHLP